MIKLNYMLIYPLKPKETVNILVHNINFEIRWNPLENSTFTNTLNEPFEKSSLKGEYIPYLNVLWTFDGEIIPF